jgi:hypothetical protein
MKPLMTRIIRGKLPGAQAIHHMSSADKVGFLIRLFNVFHQEPP